MKKDLLEKYAEAIKWFLANPDPVCIRPFLHSFGERDGFGVYELVADLFRVLPLAEVAAGLAESLQSPHRSVRYWSAHISGEYPSETLVPRLVERLNENDYDVKSATLAALERCGNKQTVDAIERYIATETDADLRSLAEEAVAVLRAK